MTSLILKKVKRKFRLLFFLLLSPFLLFSCPSVVIFEENGNYGLKNEEGQVLIPPKFEALGWSDGSSVVENGILGYRLYGKWGLISISNKRLTGPLYTTLEPAIHDYFIASTERRYVNLLNYGIIDSKGKVHVSFSYSNIRIWENKYIVTSYDGVRFQDEILLGDGRPAGLVAGKIIPFAGTAVIEKNGEFSVRNSDLALIADSLDGYRTYLQECLLVNRRNRYGLISARGEMLLDVSYKFINVSNYPVVEAHPWENLFLYNHQLECIDTLSAADYDRGIGGINKQPRRVFRDGYVGLFDYQGNPILPIVYDSIGASVKQGYICKFRGAYGIVMEDGSWFFPPQRFPLKKESYHFFSIQHPAGNQLHDMAGNQLLTYDDTLIIREPLLFSSMADSTWQIHSTLGFPIVSEVDAWWGTTDKYLIRKGRSLAVVTSKNGLQSYHPMDSGVEIHSVNDEYILFSQNGKFGMYDWQFRIRAVNRYDSLRLFEEGMAAFVLRGKWGYINEQEKIMVQPLYENAGSFTDATAIVRSGDEYGLILKNGRMAVPLNNDMISRQGKFYLIEDEGKFGLANTSGERLVFTTFDYLEPAGPYAISKKRGKYGIIDISGGTLIPHDFRDISYLDGIGIYIMKEDAHMSVFQFTEYYR